MTRGDIEREDCVTARTRRIHRRRSNVPVLRTETQHAEHVVGAVRLGHAEILHVDPSLLGVFADLQRGLGRGGIEQVLDLLIVDLQVGTGASVDNVRILGA